VISVARLWDGTFTCGHHVTDTIDLLLNKRNKKAEKLQVERRQKLLSVLSLKLLKFASERQNRSPISHMPTRIVQSITV
jgi:hypothetical protein